MGNGIWGCGLERDVLGWGFRDVVCSEVFWSLGLWEFEGVV